MRKRLGCPVVVRYASTEVPLCSGTALDDPTEIVAATVGRPLGDVEAEVRNEDGRTTRPSATGRIFLRSRGSMRGRELEPAGPAVLRDMGRGRLDHHRAVPGGVGGEVYAHELVQVERGTARCFLDIALADAYAGHGCSAAPPGWSGSAAGSCSSTRR